MKFWGDIYLDRNFGIVRTQQLVDKHTVRAPESWSKYTPFNELNKIMCDLQKPTI